MSLTDKVVSGSVWMISLRVVSKILSLSTSFLLARLLTPNDFGLVSVAILVLTGAQALSQLGLKQALIASTTENSKIYHSTWTFELIRGGIITLFLFATASLISSFFDYTEALPLIKLIAFIPLIESLASIKIVEAQKNLEFRKFFIYEISGVVSQAIISITLALIFENAWALVFGYLSNATAKVIVSYRICPYQPKISFWFTGIRENMNFGLWIFLGSVLSYLAMELDSIYTAKFFEPSVLGVYTLAFTLTNRPIQEIGKAMGQVLFPAFSTLDKGSGESIHKAYIKANDYFILLILPFPFILLLTCEDFISIFLGQEWIQMIPVVKTLAIATIFRLFVMPSTGLFNGLSKPKNVFILSIIRAITLTIGLSVLTKDAAINDVAKAVLLSNGVFFIAFLFLIKISAHIKVLDLIKSISISSIIIFSITFIPWTISNKMNPSIYRLIFNTISFVIIYLFVVFRLSRLPKYEKIKNILKIYG